MTCANLNLSWSSENTVEQNLIRDVGMKSIEDDLLEDLLMSLRTSAAGVTEAKCVKWSASEWKIGNIGRVKEG